MTFMFEDDVPPSNPSQRVGAYVGAVVVALLIAVGVGWYLFAKPGASAAPVVSDVVPALVKTPELDVPHEVDAASTTEAQTPSNGAAVGAQPVEEILDSPSARTDQAAPAVAATENVTAATAVTAAPPAPAPVPAFTPVTVPRVPDAAPVQAPPKRAKPARSDDAPWPPAVRESAQPADPMARLRGALAQCAAMSNELSRGNCLARTRQNFCGDAWGRIPECPAGQ